MRDSAFRRVLWAVLGINAAMFLLELIFGLAAASVALQADALDFLGDSGSYGISLFVAGMSLRARARAALAKGAAMGLFGLWVTGATAWHALHGTLPNAFTMGVVGASRLADQVCAATNAAAHDMPSCDLTFATPRKTPPHDDACIVIDDGPRTKNQCELMANIGFQHGNLPSNAIGGKKIVLRQKLEISPLAHLQAAIPGCFCAEIARVVD